MFPKVLNTTLGTAGKNLTVHWTEEMQLNGMIDISFYVLQCGTLEVDVDQCGRSDKKLLLKRDMKKTGCW